MPLDAIHTRGSRHTVRQPILVRKAGVDVGTQTVLNLIAGTSITLTVTEDTTNGEIDVTIDAASGVSNLWTPFGIVHPFTSKANTTISVNTTIANQVQQYGNLTINNGIVLTAGFSPQIIICKNLIFGNTSSQISANGLGAAGGAGSTSGNVLRGNGALSTVINTGSLATPFSDFLDALLAAGGAGADASTTPATGGAGTAAPARAMLAALTLYLPSLGVIGGGGGGAGAWDGAGAVGTGGAGGQRGGAGAPITLGDATKGAGGGSGIGGGGGGGAVDTDANTAGTGGSGGAGGGVLVVLCDDIQTAAGLITANGAAGTAGSGGAGVSTGGGGGGGGGLALVYTRLATVTPTVQATGGAGGAGGGATAPGSTGGAGGAGIAQLMVS